MAAHHWNFTNPSTWSLFFMTAGASNMSQALYFHYLSTPHTSAARMLGTIGSKTPKPSPITWAVVAGAGGLYAYHGANLSSERDGLHRGVIGLFAGLKIAVSARMYKILTHPKGKPGPATAFICASEAAWGAAFAYWAVTS